MPDVSQDSDPPRTISDVSQQFSQLTNALDIQQRIYNTLSPQYEAAKLSPESAPIFEIFELAEVPNAKTGPKRTQLVLRVFVGSLLSSVALVILMNLLAEWKKKVVLLEDEWKAKDGGIHG
jgi:uncharacterized protein involved in exopolysaccharide biosynthesis